jgi:formylglycine-generating enzyme required for sulfatase activity
MAGRKIGLAIGINDYSDPKLSNLRFAKKDAEEMRTVLLNPDIGRFDAIIPLVNETKNNVKKGIEKLLLKDATFDDLVLIYFSGHGKLNSKLELNLILKDTETDYLLSTALHYNFITDCIEESKCKKVVIILDCCHSGAAGTKGEVFVKPLSETSGSGTFILSATTGLNLAKEVPELENGIFTHFLLEGLRKGDADLGGDGLIDILELYEYASKKCNDEYSQVTTITNKFEERIVIGKNPLKIRENEYELKKSRLLEEFISQLSPRILDESLTILRINYENPSSLDKVEVDIHRLLESFLKGELSVENYSVAVQHLKGISLKAPILQNGSRGGISKYEVPNIGNTWSYETSRESDISKTFSSPSTDMEFVLIPAGKFMMGSPSEEQSRYDDEGPVHEVTIKNSFYIGKYPVTQKQWKKVMGNNPSNFKGEDRPVKSVSWVDVHEFVKKLNEKEGADKYRLPSEAEWEYACRAGTQTRYSFGDDESKLNKYAWYDKNSGSGTHPVGQKKPNSWNLYDMHGNVWEWVQDGWHDKYEGAPSDGSAWEDGNSSFRVFRGGSWHFDARYCRSAVRNWFDPSDRDGDVGFRLLRKL